MSKKKNTLKDLDEFLKQQAATLVSPEKLSTKIEQTPAPQPVAEKTPSAPVADKAVSAEKILSDLKALANDEGEAFRDQLYDLIIKSVETQGSFTPEDRMLINTALYLKSGTDWKASIREYWRSKKNHR